MLKQNYAESLKGLAMRIFAKLAAVTCLQYINNNKPINQLKYALAF
ncbi:hypothetical protein ADIARSV_0879 [Arcticibacter svalbardensis MN12-7]|uniref:Mobile element protein n=1 Tax=Arcticibacter svalbardensis MN12-7 TaxID=1150600 RepID=R9H417_9SPHI|nr:hypothetical protein ADIARSV_0879 [Arcticibacter svalbardensis MN12-7]